MSPQTAITIGTFDSVHRGHASLIRTAREHVGPEGYVIVASFDPHPRSVLTPNATPARLTTFEQRQQLARAHGADQLVRLTPTPQLLSLSPRQFIESILEQHSPSCIVEGPDFHFGAQRAGSIETLQQLARELDFTTICVPPVTVSTSDQLTITASSTSVRWFLENGRAADAAEVLARPYSITGTVTRGRQLGRRIGFPTANLSNVPTMIPADAVYAGWAVLPDSSRLPCALSFGTNPTFPNAGRSAEAHIIDWHGPNAGEPEYDWPLTIEVSHWLREQIAFPGVRTLVEQIQRDVDHARTMLEPTPTRGRQRLQGSTP
ncbi:MAG: riboflavin biosynthesis protein RibF [Planctomycetota bacterium]|jgi:riboflavin kinase/FMN adenylyltransferase